MLATCTDGLIGLRDCALLLFAFSSGGRRRSEVAHALIENLVKVDDGVCVYHLTHSKIDQAGTEHNTDADKPVVGVAAEALTAWLEASGVPPIRQHRPRAVAAARSEWPRTTAARRSSMETITPMSAFSIQRSTRSPFVSTTTCALR